MLDAFPTLLTRLHNVLYKSFLRRILNPKTVTNQSIIFWLVPLAGSIGILLNLNLVNEIIKSTEKLSTTD